MSPDTDMDPTKTSRHIKVILLGNASRMDKPELIRTFLNAMIDSIGMQAISIPRALVVEAAVERLRRGDPTADEGGISGNLSGHQIYGDALVGTSHVYVHTWPERQLAVVDVFSCIDFDTNAAVELCRTFFWAQRMKATDVSESMRWS